MIGAVSTPAPVSNEAIVLDRLSPRKRCVSLDRVTYLPKSIESAGSPGSEAVEHTREQFTGGGDGKVVLSQSGTNVLELFIGSRVASANWLAKYNLDAYIIETQSTSNKAEMNWYFRGGIPYEIRAEDLPKGSSIWLRYVYPSRWDMPLIGRPR